MSPITQLIGFSLRQVIGDYADGPVQIAAAVEQRFRDHSRTLPKALDHAHQRAWQALGLALAGDGLLDRVKVFFASGDDKGVREQVQLFLEGNAVSFAVETHGAVLDIQTELQRSHGEARILMEQVLLRPGQVGMARGEVRPGNSCSIRGEDWFVVSTENPGRCPGLACFSLSGWNTGLHPKHIVHQNRLRVW